MRRREIIVTGGGSGGHIVPTLAVATAIKDLDNTVHIRYVLDSQSAYKKLVQDHPAIDTVQYVFAGKLRRYHGVSIGRQLLDIPTLVKNMRDIVYLLIGFMQSLVLLLVHRPCVIFVKGGFVGVPVGLAAALLRIPYITHDSDATPGLANRLIARWAYLHAVGMPVGNYAYPRTKTVETGVPIDENRFFVVDAATKHKYRDDVKVPIDVPIVLVVGGGGGARSVDDLLEASADSLLAIHTDLHLVHIFGKLNEHLLEQRYSALAPERRARVHKISFTDKLHVYSGAADVIVSRAGATNMAEFAHQSKACVVIPAAHLTGGHQTKNAQVYASAQAAVVLDEASLQSDPKILIDTLSRLLRDDAYREKLGRRLHEFATSGSAQQIARLLLETSEK